jgi:nucleotide-binding universal stress UspA family protein
MIAKGKVSLRGILAATDFSAQSQRAFEAALALAEIFGAELHVLHVVSGAAKQKLAQEHLDGLGKEIGVIEIVRAIAVGHAASEIVKYAEREKIDLIVLGTHGRSGLARVLMGSVAEAVVRTAPCQVLTIGPKTQAVEEAPAPKEIPAHQSHCLVCAKPSRETICDNCKAHIQGEAIERKRRDEQAGHRGVIV